MWAYIKKAINTNLNKALDTLITEKHTTTDALITARATQASVNSDTTIPLNVLTQAQIIAEGLDENLIGKIFASSNELGMALSVAFNISISTSLKTFATVFVNSTAVNTFFANEMARNLFVNNAHIVNLMIANATTMAMILGTTTPNYTRRGYFFDSTKGSNALLASTTARNWFTANTLLVETVTGSNTSYVKVDKNCYVLRARVLSSNSNTQPMISNLELSKGAFTRDEWRGAYATAWQNIYKRAFSLRGRPATSSSYSDTLEIEYVQMRA